MFKLEDRRDEQSEMYFATLYLGDGFIYNGSPYMKTSREHALKLDETIDENMYTYIGQSQVVQPVQLTITITDLVF